MNISYDLAWRKKQGGFLLVAALGFIIAFSFLIVIVSQKLRVASDAQLLSMLSVQANNAANSGVEEGVYLTVSNKPSRHYCKTMSLQRQLDEPGLKNCRVNISCSVVSAEEGAEEGAEMHRASIYLISSQAYCGSGSIYATRTVEIALLDSSQENRQQKLQSLYRKIK